MILSGNENRDKTIEYLLENGGSTAQEIEAFIDSFDSMATSGVYKMLNKLLDEEIVIKQGTKFYINEEWRQGIIADLETSCNQVLQEGERLTYKLNSVYEIDKHWKHYAYQIEKEMNCREVHYYNPHQFWIYLEDRGNTEKTYMRHLENINLKVKHTIWGKSKWDKQFTAIYRSKQYRINTGIKYNFKITDNISVFGDYIINTKVTAGLYQKITHAYQNSKDENELINKINDAAKTSPCRFILERNHKKAARLRYTLSKDFA